MGSEPLEMRLVQVDVEGAVEPQRDCDGRDNLANQPVEVLCGLTSRCTSSSSAEMNPLDARVPCTDLRHHAFFAWAHVELAKLLPGIGPGLPG